LKHFVANATAERVTFKLKATGCTTSGSNIPVVNSGVISGVFNTVDSSCLRVTPFNTTPPVTLVGLPNLKIYLGNITLQ